MKRFLIILTLTLLPLAASAQLDTIRVSTLATTHIRFASDLKYVDISNKVIAAKIVEGSKDILALKAREAFDFVTTVSCLEANGSMHSFFVAYSPAPARLVFDTRRKAAPGAQAAQRPLREKSPQAMRKSQTFLFHLIHHYPPMQPHWTA